MTDSSGSVQGQYTYDPYGRATTLQGSLQSDFQFARCYIHQRSGLNLTLRRAYSSQFGRFLSRDPIGERGGKNLFAYVSNGPNLWIDPSGLKPEPGKARYNEGEADPINPGGDDGDHGEGEHYVPPPPPFKKPDCVDRKNCDGRPTRTYNRAVPDSDSNFPCTKGDNNSCCKDSEDDTMYDSCGKRVCDTGPHHDQPPPPPNPAGASKCMFFQNKVRVCTSVFSHWAWRNASYRTLLILLIFFATNQLQSVAANPLAEKDNNVGVNMMGKRDYKGAIEEFSKSLSKDPNFVIAFVNRGLAKAKLKDFEGAVKDYNAALHIDRHNFSALSGRAQAYENLRMFDKAILDLSTLIDLNQGSRSFYLKKKSKSEEKAR